METMAMIFLMFADYMLTKKTIELSSKVMTYETAVNQERNIMARFFLKKFGIRHGIIFGMLFSLLSILIIFQYFSTNFKWGIIGAQSLMLYLHMFNIDDLQKYIKQKEDQHAEMGAMPEIDFQLNS
jgi:uncharacterized membrane protein